MFQLKKQKSEQEQSSKVESKKKADESFDFIDTTSKHARDHKEKLTKEEALIELDDFEHLS